MNKKSNILTDNLGWILLALASALILMAALYYITKAYNIDFGFLGI